MANRMILAINKIDEFKEWLIKKGYTIAEPKDYWEVIRAKSKDGKWLIVYHKIEPKVHYTVRNADMPVVRAFISERRKAKNEKRISVTDCTATD